MLQAAEGESHSMGAIQIFCLCKVGTAKGCPLACLQFLYTTLETREHMGLGLQGWRRKTSEWEQQIVTHFFHLPEQNSWVRGCLWNLPEGLTPASGLFQRELLPAQYTPPFQRLHFSTVLKPEARTLSNIKEDIFSCTNWKQTHTFTWSSLPGLVEGDPAYAKEIANRWSQKSSPTWIVLWFYETCKHQTDLETVI